MTDKVPGCVNGLAVFISRQCANKLSVPLQPKSYNTSIIIKRKLAVNHPIYQHFASDELNKFNNCMLTKSSLKTEYSRLYPAIAEEEPEEEASSTSTSPTDGTDMTAAFQEFMTAEKRAAPTPSSDRWSKRVELFTKTEERPPCLELLHSALSTVQCASYLSGG